MSRLNNVFVSAPGAGTSANSALALAQQNQAALLNIPPENDYIRDELPAAPIDPLVRHIVRTIGTSTLNRGTGNVEWIDFLADQQFQNGVPGGNSVNAFELEVDTGNGFEQAPSDSVGSISPNSDNQVITQEPSRQDLGFLTDGILTNLVQLDTLTPRDNIHPKFGYRLTFAAPTPNIVGARWLLHPAPVITVQGAVIVFKWEGGDEEIINIPENDFEWLEAVLPELDVSISYIFDPANPTAGINGYVLLPRGAAPTPIGAVNTVDENGVLIDEEGLLRIVQPTDGSPSYVEAIPTTGVPFSV